MKKPIAVSLALAAALLLAACGSENGGAVTSTTTHAQANITENSTKNNETTPEPEKTAEAETPESAVQYAEPAAEDFEYNYDAVLGGVKITKYNGDAVAIRIPVELDGDPVKQFKLDNEEVTHVEIPDGFAEINESAFYNCRSLTSVIIPDSVTAIGGAAFSMCLSLTDITIPDGVTEIGSSAFWDCNELVSINIPDGVTEIGSNTFWGCRNLTEITIPDGVTLIGNSAFVYCTKLRSLTLPDNVTVKKSAFYGCDGLTVTCNGEQYTYANDPGRWWVE